MKLNITNIVVILLVSIINGSFITIASALAPSEQFSDIQLRNLDTDEQGYLSNTSNDGHIVFNDLSLTRDQMCGVLLTIEFKETPLRASLFDVYWRTAQVNFTESQKGFFLINQNDAAQKTRYLLPICKLFGFSGNLHNPLIQGNITGFRLDYPPNKDTSLRIESAEFLDSQALSELLQQQTEIIALELYESVPARSFTSLDVIIPKLVFAFEEGIKRLGLDLPFLIFWLCLIFLLKLLLLKSFVRQFKSDDDLSK